MSNEVIGLFFAAGSAAWIYNKMMKITGSNTQVAVIVAGIGALFAFLILWSILGVFLSD